MTLTQSKYTHRLLARVIIEAQTPLTIGSGQKDFLSDALVVLDVNGLPYLPGTSIAGVVRSMLDPKHESAVFGYQKADANAKEKEPALKGKGSEIIFSEARILNSRQQVMDGVICPSEIEKDSLLREYRRMLPIRQHVHINDKGTAADTGKFDQQVVFAGSRFCFEVEMLSCGESNVADFRDVLNALGYQSFRIGGGVHNGFGEISIVELKTATLNLTDKDDLDKYLSKSSSLASDWHYWQNHQCGEFVDDSYITYQLTLQPDSFFFFGSGFGDASGDADMTTVKETRIDWSSGTGRLVFDQLLIPATSVKGALRHRVAYRYNQLQHCFVDGTPDKKPQDADHNEAVRILFGYQEGKVLQAGKVLFSDIIEAPATHKYVNHVSIDRFTGGAIEGALFTEQVDYAADRKFTLKILVEKRAFSEETPNVKEAFEQALNDLRHGLLPLGGGVNRGNGIFTGTYTNQTNE